MPLSWLDGRNLEGVLAPGSSRSFNAMSGASEGAIGVER